MNADNALRAACGVAAMLVLCWPYMGMVRGSISGVVSRLGGNAAGLNSGATAADLSMVLALASRLSRAGCAEGVALCQKLIDVLLRPAK